jgi:zinc protease
MRRFLTLAVLVPAWLGALPAFSQPLPTDPRLVSGELPDGMKYIVVEHDNPPGRALMWIHIDTGSLNETDDQRGVAHYLEHMAFNGSANFPPGSVVPYFESLGLTFGQHQNAFTSFDQTTYQLSLPDTKPETVAKGLSFFSDIVSNLSLLPEEVENERQVILEEWRSRLSGRQRINDIIFEGLAPGSLFGERIPIGTEQSIRAMAPRDFRDYYQRWYVPSNMTLIVVADTDPEAIIDSITGTFGKGQKVKPPAEASAGVRPYTENRAIIATDPEVRDIEISINKVDAAAPPVTTVGQLRRSMAQQIGSWAFNRRMQAKLAAGGASYQRAGASVGNFSTLLRRASASAAGEPGKWKDMLAELSLELQRARLHGFTERELADARKDILAGAEEAVRREPTTPARAIVAGINESITTGETNMSAAQFLEVVSALLPQVTVEEVSSLFAHDFDPTNVTFILQGSSEIERPSETELIALGVAALNVSPEPSSEADRPDALMAAVPEPAPIAELSQQPQAEVWSAWLANGIRVHYRYMDYRKNDATVSITLAGGPVEETAENRGVSDAAAIAWSGRTAATRSLTSTNIRDLMTGKNVNVQGRAGTDTMSLSVGGSPQDLEHGMQLAHLLLTQPQIEASAFDNWKQRQRQAIQARKSTPVGVFQEVLFPTIYGSKTVPGVPLEMDQVEKLTLEQSQAWLDRIIATAPIEVAVVGDMDKEQAFDLVRRYLGTLPARERIAPSTNLALRTLERPRGARIISQDVETQTPQAMVVAGFYGVDGTDVQGRRRMQLASKVLSSRMITRLREEQQLVYSISASSSPAAAFPGFGLFMAASLTEPAKAQALADAIDAMFAEFAQDGPTKEEVEVARKQMANSLDENMREPRFWLGQLSDLTYRGIDLADVVADPEAYQTITAADIKNAFGTCYTDDSRIIVSVKPRDSEAKQVEDAAAAEEKKEP